jgi:hypothetical protein
MFFPRQLHATEERTMAEKISKANEYRKVPSLSIFVIRSKFLSCKVIVGIKRFINMTDKRNILTTKHFRHYIIEDENNREPK